jgi:hypothetical protein
VSDVDKPTWTRIFINAIYVLGTIVGSIVAAYGTFIFVGGVVVAPSYFYFGLACGLPLLALSLPFLGFSLRMLFSQKFKVTKYNSLSWASVLLGSLAMVLFAYYVFVYLRGI